jgi:hypothetical protein
MPEVEKPDLGHRTAAVQILAQLPETQADALLVLEAARDFVLKFLAEDHLEEAGRPLPRFARGVRRLGLGAPGLGLGD